MSSTWLASVRMARSASTEFTSRAAPQLGGRRRVKRREEKEWPIWRREKKSLARSLDGEEEEAGREEDGGANEIEEDENEKRTMMTNHIALIVVLNTTTILRTRPHSVFPHSVSLRSFHFRSSSPLRPPIKWTTNPVWTAMSTIFDEQISIVVVNRGPGS